MVIAQEAHTKTIGKHLHCYVELNKRYTNRGAHDRLYLKGPEELIFKVNLKAAWYKHGWLKYISKSDPEPYEEGIKVEQFLQAKVSKQAVVCKRLLEGEKLKDLIEEEGNEYLLASYSSLEKNMRAYTKAKA